MLSKIGAVLRGKKWQEVVTEAGLDWEVTKNQLARASDGLMVDAWGIFKKNDEENDQFLGACGRTFVALQNKEKFSWIDSLLQDTDFVYTNAGTIDDNRQIFAMVDLNRSYNVGGTEYRAKFTAINSHEQGKALRMFLTLEDNKGLLLNSELDTAIKIYHSKRTATRLETVKNVLVYASEEAEKLIETLQKMNAKAFTNEQEINKALDAVFGKVKKEKKKLNGELKESKLENIRNDFLRVYEMEKNKTQFGFFQSLQKWADTMRRVNTPTSLSETEKAFLADKLRNESALLGKSNDLKAAIISFFAESEIGMAA